MSETEIPSTLYDQLAVYYDLINASVTDDIQFFLQLARQQSGPILEVGCGSGRILIPIAEAGLEIVGLDNSRPMLDRAEARLRNRSFKVPPRLVLGDMTRFDLQTLSLIHI